MMIIGYYFEIVKKGYTLLSLKIFKNNNKLYCMNNAKLKILLGKRVQELRKARNLTQQQVADRMNIDIRNYRRIERGESFPARNIIPLAEALDVTLSQLYDCKHLELDEASLREAIKKSADTMSMEQLVIIYKMINSIYN